MTSLHPFPEIHEDLMAVEDILLSLPREAGAPVEDILSGAIPGGKRIRPSVVLLAGRMLGGPRRSLVEIAAAIEMIHIGTLVHDDIIDSVPRRRGHDSLHTLWGVSPAVLAGDFLLSAGLGRVASLGDPGLVSVLTDAVCSVCRGEIRELGNIGRTGTKREEYFRVVGEKTASLFSAGMVMAGMVSGAGNETLYALENSGRLLGTAFQLVDDIADITGDERVTGKVPGTDLRRGIVTLPVIIFAEMQGNRCIPEPLCQGNPDEDAVRDICREIRASGAIEECQKAAGEIAMETRKLLASFPDNCYREALDRLAQEIVGPPEHGQ